MKKLSLVLIFGMSFDAASVEPEKNSTTMEPVQATQLADLPPTRVSDEPNAYLNALKQNDFAALMEIGNGNKNLADIASEWDAGIERRRSIAAKAADEAAEAHDDSAVLKPDNPTERAWTNLQSDQGIDQLIAEWQPQLSGANEHIQQMIQSLTLSMARDDLTADQVAERMNVLQALTLWQGKTDFTDPLRLRRALQAVSQSVRATGLEKFSDVQDLRFEDAVIHGDNLIKTIKQVLLAYDVDADQILDSVRISEIDAVGNTATLLVEATIFGVNVSRHSRMKYHNDVWLDEALATSLQRAVDESDEAFGDLDAPVDAVSVEAETDSAASAAPGSCSPDADYGKSAAATAATIKED